MLARLSIELDKAFFLELPHLVLHRAQREAELERRFNELDKRVDEISIYRQPPVIIQNPYPQIAPIIYGTTTTWNFSNDAVNDSDEPPAAMFSMVN